MVVRVLGDFRIRDMPFGVTTGYREREDGEIRVILK